MDIVSLSLGGRTTLVRLVSGDDLLAHSSSRALVVFDRNTIGLPVHSPSHPSIILPAGEQAKSPSVLQELLDACARNRLARGSTLIAVGGGAVTDAAALAAAMYMRGIGLVLVPTTLLAMVDAAVGGKTGINFAGTKNLVGVFYPAGEVRICLRYLDTLPDSEYFSGLAEIIKAGLLADPRLVEILETERDRVVHRDPQVVRDLITRAVRVKADVVQSDFTERGRRAILNLGHTFAHALEATVGLGEWTHGAAVAWGMAQAMAAGEAVGVTDPAYRKRVQALLTAYGYVVEGVDLDPERMIGAMGSDKKRTETDIRFVLQKNLGDTCVRTLPTEIVAHILKVQQGGKS